MRHYPPPLIGPKNPKNFNFCGTDGVVDSLQILFHLLCTSLAPESIFLIRFVLFHQC
jgi:hypothetical protein